MRLYAFDCIVEGRHLRGFMSRIDGPLTCGSVEVNGITSPIEADKWIFDRVMVARASEGHIVQKVVTQVRRKGYSITGMEAPPTRFHVTDVVLDGGSVRLYSTERNIERFKEALRRLQLSRDGDPFHIKSEDYIGEVNICSQKQAEQLGIESYLQLVKQEMASVVLSKSDPISLFENTGLRKMNKQFREMGITVTDFKLEKVIRADTREDILPEMRNPRQNFAPVFLSHTSHDKPFARQLRTDLMERGVAKVWIDEAEIKVGESLLEKIQQALKDTKYFAIILSPKALESNWVRKELEYAMHREIASDGASIIPILYEDCEIPPFLAGKLYADFRDPTRHGAGVELLLDRLALPSWRMRHKTT
jgi:hypothetical protein